MWLETEVIPDVDSWSEYDVDSNFILTQLSMLNQCQKLTLNQCCFNVDVPTGYSVGQEICMVSSRI